MNIQEILEKNNIKIIKLSELIIQYSKISTIDFLAFWMNCHGIGIQNNYKLRSLKEKVKILNGNNYIKINDYEIRKV